MTFVQSAWDAASPEAGRILWLLRAFIVVLGAIYAVVVAALARALTRRERAQPSDAGLRRGLSVATGATVLLLFVILSVSVHATRELSDPPASRYFDVIGHQWWWEVRYVSPDPTERFATANEIHLPVGRPMKIVLESRDVIHSLWIPSLHGKTDLIPGLSNTTVLEADRPGVFRGQCAEFCGLQHAHMAIDVVAEREDAYQAWLAAQRRAAAAPGAAASVRGRLVFMSTTCATCHAVVGTEAGARLGPDLTHFGSRATIAAGTLPNTAEALGAWITEPQQFKPGTRMPATPLSGQAAADVAAYLEDLR